MLFSDLALSRRLERAEGYACVQFAKARRVLFPDSEADWLEYGGAYAGFSGVDSPVTQSFGLGLCEPLSSETLDVMERFFEDHGAPVMHEVCPLAGVAALDLLCARGYRPIEISSVLYRTLEAQDIPEPDGSGLRRLGRLSNHGHRRPARSSAGLRWRE